MKTYTMNEVLAELEISPGTLFRWERLKYIKLSKQFDENRKRVFSEQDLEKLKEYKESKAK